jgi:hypothetical protein
MGHDTENYQNRIIRRFPVLGYLHVNHPFTIRCGSLKSLILKKPSILQWENGRLSGEWKSPKYSFDFQDKENNNE